MYILTCSVENSFPPVHIKSNDGDRDTGVGQIGSQRRRKAGDAAADDEVSSLMSSLMSSASFDID